MQYFYYWFLRIFFKDLLNFSFLDSIIAQSSFLQNDWNLHTMNRRQAQSDDNNSHDSLCQVSKKRSHFSYLNHVLSILGCVVFIIRHLIFLTNPKKGASWSLYGSWIYNYLCNQCLSPLTLWVRIMYIMW